MIYLENKEVYYHSFPDSTLACRFDFSELCSFEHIIIKWKYEDDKELWLLYCLVSKLREINLNIKIKLVLPYVPNARQDRLINKNDCFTLKYFCNFINDLKLDKVFITDPHSNVTPALLNNCVIIKADIYINKLLDNKFNKDKDIIFYPDFGAAKRYDIKDFKYLVGYKQRDLNTGKIIKYDIISNDTIINPKNILIIDDISSYGGTFLYAAKDLHERFPAAKIYLYVTHCENSILHGDLIKSNLLSGIYTTKSIFTKYSNLITFVEDL